MRLNTPIQLGPWGITESVQYSKQIVQQPKQKVNRSEQRSSLLPKLPQLALQKKLPSKPTRQTQLKLIQSLKMSPIHIGIANRLSRRVFNSETERRKQRVGSYDPPMISFYNLKHPKIKRKIEEREPVNIIMGNLVEETVKEANLSRVNLLQGYLRSSEGYSALRYKNQVKRDIMCPKKRSLTQLLRYLTNKSSEQQIGHPSFLTEQQKQFSRYTQKQEYSIRSILGKKQNDRTGRMVEQTEVG